MNLKEPGLPVSQSGLSALEAALKVAARAGQTLLGRFDTPKKVVHKGRANIATDVDTLVEGQIVSFLREEFPQLGILAEESPKIEGESEYLWIVDPLDGTRNYALGVPHFCVVVALARKEEVLVGVTHDPVRGETFVAQKGKGATLNGRPISVSRRVDLQESILGFDMGYSDDMALKAVKMVESLWPGMQGIRVMGSAALGLAYAACGRLDIYFHHHLMPWDLVSGLLQVKEAGGFVTDRDGTPASIYKMGVIAGNATLHRNFLHATEGMEWRRP